MHVITYIQYMQKQCKYAESNYLNKNDAYTLFYKNI